MNPRSISAIINYGFNLMNGVLSTIGRLFVYLIVFSPACLRPLLNQGLTVKARMSLIT